MDESQKAEIGKMIGAGIASYFASEEGKKALSGGVATAVGEATTTLSKSLEALTTKVDGLAAAPAANGDDKNKGKGKDKAGGDEPNAIQAALDVALKPINDRFARMDAEAASVTQAKAVDEAILKGLTSKGFSGLAANPLFKAFAASKGVKTDAEAVAALEEFRAAQKALGVEIKPTAASPAAEGAKGAPAGGEGKGLTIEEQRERLAEIQKRTEPKTVK